MSSVVLAQADSPEEAARKDFERRVRQEQIGGRYIPGDLNDAMQALDGVVSLESRESYAAQPEDFVVQQLFFSFGRWIAINWGLYDGSRFSLYLQKLGVDQPDGQKEFVMRAYHRYLNGQDINVAELATRYKTQKARQDSIRRAKATVIESYTRPAKGDDERG